MTLKKISKKKLRQIRRHVRRLLAARRRREARRRPLHPPIDYAEVAAISEYLDARAQDPHEWSSGERPS